MKKLREQFEEIIKDLDWLSDEQWLKKNGSLTIYQVLIKAVMDRDEYVIGKNSKFWEDMGVDSRDFNRIRNNLRKCQRERAQETL